MKQFRGTFIVVAAVTAVVLEAASQARAQANTPELPRGPYLTASIAAGQAAPGGGLEGLLDWSTSGGPKTLKDLAAPTWKHVRITLATGGKDESPVGGLFGALMGGAMGGTMGSMVSQMSSGVATAGDDVYYTQGKTLSLGSETFLITYKPRAGDDDGMANLLKMSKSDTPPPPPKAMTGETPVAATLLNLHSIATLKDIRPFDLAGEIAASAAQAANVAEMLKDKSSSPAFDDLPKTEITPPPAPKPAKPKSSNGAKPKA